LNYYTHNDDLFFRLAITRAGNTVADLELVFNETTPSADIPPATEVAETLMTAPVNTSAGSVTFVNDTIVVTSMF